MWRSVFDECVELSVKILWSRGAGRHAVSAVLMGNKIVKGLGGWLGE